MRKVLVLAVDYDDDISKAGVTTPVVGYSNLVDAALKFGSVFPDDSDLNVLFHALHLYKELKEGEYEPEVALISGSSESHVEAGRKLRDQLSFVLKQVNVGDVVLVLDSVEDELVIPVVQNQANLIAIERVVVEQLRGIEETYVLIGKYLRKAIEDPKYSKIFFGLPGLLFLVYALISASPYAKYAWEITLVFLGIFMILKGFHVPEFISKKWYSSSIYRVTAVLSLASISIGTAFLVGALVARNFSADLRSISTYVKTFLPFLTLSLVVLHTGRLTSRLLRRSLRAWRDVVAVLFIVAVSLYVNNVVDIVMNYPELDILAILYDLKVINVVAVISLSLVAVYVMLSYVERYVLGYAKRT
ncbi:MAG: DUF373 family protein [Sulfolobales archaeon]|nr:DUF373 family protein [Sulfolobales archaeon]MCX8208392.1 DUF373 family protein [Sulfolobales archaeon]